MGGIIFVVLLHLGVIYFLSTALNINVVKMLDPFDVDILSETSTDEPPPPPPPSVEKPPPDYIPPPEISFAPSESSGSAITSVTNTQSVTPQSDKRRPNPRPDYPEASIRLNEEGSVILALYVTPQGTVSDAKVEKSSGFPRLDEAAQRASLRYRFVPGKQGGQPAAMWHRIKITFRLCEAKQTKCS